MRQWFDARELVGAPGMPTTVQGINYRGKLLGWTRRINEGTGSAQAWEYALEALPPKSQAFLLLKHNPQPQAPASSEPSEPWALYDAKPSRIKAEAAERQKILMAVEQLVEGGAGKVEATVLVAQQTGTGAATIRGWQRLVRGVPRADWLPLLAPAWCGRTATAACSPQAWEYFKGDYLRQAEPALTACYERLQRVAPGEGWTVPSLKTLQRRIEREIPRGAFILARKGPQALKQIYPAQQRSHAVFRAMEATNADGHKFDVFVKWEDGTIGRPLMVAVQDIYSGKIVGYRTGQSETADAVRLAFGDAFAAYGPSDHVYLDNGRGFAAKWISGGAATRFRFKIKAEDPAGVLVQLGCKIHWATPYHGQAKPIERAFRDLCETVAKHPAFEGAYTGNSPTAKPENYGSRAIPINLFLSILDTEIAAHNQRLKRRSDVCGGIRSFDQVFAESYAAGMARTLSDEQRRLFLLAAEGITADRSSGALRLFDNRYWAPSLIELAGQRLVVRFDPAHLDKPVHVYRLDGRYLTSAERIEKAGFDDLAKAREHEKARRAHIKAGKQSLAAERRMSALEVAEMLPAMEPAPAPDRPSIVRPVFGNLAVAAHAESLPQESPVAEDRMLQFRSALDRLALQKRESL